MSSQSVEIELPDKIATALQTPSRYRVWYGGRGGAKSWSAARALLYIGMARPTRILCGREVQKSIKESVYQLLKDQISELGLDTHYTVVANEVRGKNGTLFLFTGLSDHTSDSIKSFEGIDIFWGEEADKITKRSWKILIPTIRKDGSEIWITFNPNEESDETYQRFVVNPPDNAQVIKIGWRDNPWFPSVLDEERRFLQRVDPAAYQHVWEGECISHSDDQVLHGKIVVEDFIPEDNWHGPYMGADWGFSQDPTTLVKCWVFGRSLYIEHEAWGIGVDIDATPSLFDSVPGARRYRITADNARPETISYMNKHGFMVDAAEKGKGSVEDGVQHLRSYEQIVIHPRCTHTIEEGKLYKYKRDKLTDEITTTIIDAHNHCWDAIRYALEKIMKYGRKTGKTQKFRPVQSSWMGM